jgi:hypothetical protein
MDMNVLGNTKILIQAIRENQFLAEMGTSDTFIDLPIFNTYRMQKKVSKYRTSKVSED